MKKILLLALVMLGGVMQSNATTKRIYVQVQESSWQNNNDGVWIYINEVTGTKPGTRLTRISNDKNWYYVDINSEKTDAKCQLITNTSSSYWESTEGSIDLSKNNVIYSYNDNGTQLSINDFSGYVIANSERTKLVDLTQEGLSLTGSIDFSEYASDTNFAIFPSFTNDDNGTQKYVWDVAVRPVSSGDYWLNAFKIISGTIAYNNNTWIEKQRMKYNVSINLADNSFTFIPSYTFKISDASGYATYSNDEMCTISGPELYVVNETNSTYVKLDKKNNTTIWPKKEGLIIKGAQDDDVTVTAVASDADPTEIGDNYLVGIGNTTTEVTATDYTYVFANDGTNGVGFYKASGTGNLGAHKAYLDLNRSTSDAREFLSFSFNDETGINEVSAANNSGAIYNLQGVRQNQLQKGLNIVNGKKFLVK